MVFRFVLAPLLFVSGLLCFLLGAVGIFGHIKAHVLVSVPSSPHLAPVDLTLLMLLGIFFICVAALIFEAKDFGGLSIVLGRFVGRPNFGGRLRPIGKFPARTPDRMANLRVSEPYVFISYSHSDEEWRQAIMKWLEPSLRRWNWSVWTDASLVKGYEWTPQLEWAIAHSSVAVCLVSQDFVASPFIATKELPALRIRPKNTQYGIDWIPISTAMVDAVELDKIQALWSPNHPVAELERPQQARAMKHIVETLMKKIGEQNEPAPDPPRPEP